MTFSPTPPDSRLAPFVDSLWLHQPEEPGPVVERVLPTGHMQLILSLTDDGIGHYLDPAGEKREAPMSLVTGVNSRFGAIDSASMKCLVGVSFRPNGAYPFLGLPASELLNQPAPLDDLWGPLARELREKLLYAESDETRLGLLTDALLERLRNSRETTPAVSFALRRLETCNEGESIGSIAEEAGVTPGRLAQSFSAEVGLTPKIYARIQRFQRALARLYHGSDESLANLAADFGYYDQAHFCHDFRAFAGMSPREYLSVRTEHRNHVLVPDD